MCRARRNLITREPTKTMRRFVIEIGLPWAVLAMTMSATAILGIERSTTAQQAKSLKVLRVNHQTSPIGTGHIIGGIYRIEIAGTIIVGKKGSGEIRFESSLPELDDFGDRVSRNEVLTTGKVEFSFIDRADATGRGRKIYEIELVGARPGGPRFVLVTDEKDMPCKLVIKDGKEHTAISLAAKDEDLPSAKQKPD
jgi:hypothetical protein